MAKWRDRRPSDYSLPSTDDVLDKIRTDTGKKIRSQHIVIKNEEASPSDQDDQKASDQSSHGISHTKLIARKLPISLLSFVVLVLLLWQVVTTHRISEQRSEIKGLLLDNEKRLLAIKTSVDNMKVGGRELDGNITGLDDKIKALDGNVKALDGKIDNAIEANSRINFQVEEIRDRAIRIDRYMKEIYIYEMCSRSPDFDRSMEPYELIYSVQFFLTNEGGYSVDIDGKWGAESKSAFGSWMAADQKCPNLSGKEVSAEEARECICRLRAKTSN